MCKVQYVYVSNLSLFQFLGIWVTKYVIDYILYYNVCLPSTIQFFVDAKVWKSWRNKYHIFLNGASLLLVGPGKECAQQRTNESLVVFELSGLV